MINLNEMMNLYNKLRSNPMAILSQFGIPADIANNPQQIIQTMLNKGAITQDQLNKAMEMKNNPMFKGLFK